jgi:hypothetical protein
MRVIVATRLQLVDSPFVTTTPEDSAGTRKVYKDHNPEPHNDQRLRDYFGNV